MICRGVVLQNWINKSFVEFLHAEEPLILLLTRIFVISDKVRNCKIRFVGFVFLYIPLVLCRLVFLQKKKSKNTKTNPDKNPRKNPRKNTKKNKKMEEEIEESKKIKKSKKMERIQKKIKNLRRNQNIQKNQKIQKKIQKNTKK